MVPRISPNCSFCEGYGFWPGENIPLTQEEAEDGLESDPCWNCNQDNDYWATLKGQLDDANEVVLPAPTSKLTIDDLKDFDKLCAE